MTFQLARRGLLVAAVVLLGCGDSHHSGTGPADPNSPPDQPADTIAPGRIADLTVDSVDASIPDSIRVTLRWTATGDDGDAGCAARYDLRFARGDSASFVFATAAQVPLLTPAPHGTAEHAIISGLQAGERYTFALRVGDEVPNWSGLSPLLTAVLPLPPERPPECHFSADTLRFGSIPVGTAAEQRAVLGNRGGGHLEGTVPSQPQGEFWVVSGAGPFSLGPGDSLVVIVRFAPSRSGSASGALSFGAATCGPVILRGEGTAPPPPPPACETQPDLVEFGSVEIGASAERSVRIRNAGGGVLSGTLSEACPDFEIISGGGPFALSAGDSVRALLRFSPSTEGEQACSLSTGLAGCGALACRGTGTVPPLPPDCAVAPAALEFDTLLVGETRDLSFTIKNSGGGRLNGEIPDHCWVFEVVAGAGPYSLGPGESKEVTVRYAPHNGSHDCRLSLGGSCPAVPCTGVCVTPPPPPQCSLEYGGLIFPSVFLGSSATLSFEISNDGGGTLSGDVSGGCGPFNVTSGAGPFQLRAGETRPVEVRYSPSAAGRDTCSFSIGTSCISMPCFGECYDTVSVCRVTPPALDFEPTVPGSPRTSWFSITNDGAGRLSGTVAPSCPGFVVLGNRSYSLASGEEREFTVLFMPEEAGTVRAELPLGSPRCAALPLEGRADGPASMVLIPAGLFTMGNDSGTGQADETPRHTPALSAYLIDTHEVSNEAYAAALNWAFSHDLLSVNTSFVRTAGSSPQYLLYLQDTWDEYNRCRILWDGSEFSVDLGYDRQPVAYLTWYGAAAYCNWRSAIEGLAPAYDASTWALDRSANGYRLPTEAEWERAARGSADARTYPWGAGIDCDHANYTESPMSYCMGTTVAIDEPSYSAGNSPYGAAMMSGNVAEWCQDWYAAGAYSESGLSDPTGPATGTFRVFRGGSWSDGANALRCSARSYGEPGFRSSCVGFRCVRRP